MRFLKLLYSVASLSAMAGAAFAAMPLSDVQMDKMTAGVATVGQLPPIFCSSCTSASSQFEQPERCHHQNQRQRNRLRPALLDCTAATERPAARRPDHYRYYALKGRASMASAARGGRSQNKVLDKLRRSTRRTRHWAGDPGKRSAMGMRRDVNVFLMRSSAIIGTSSRAWRHGELTCALIGRTSPVHRGHTSEIF